MVALARKTLIFEWRRFLPAILAVGFAGLLQLLQAALVLGIFSGASVYVTQSSADLWVGYPGTQSVSLGSSIPTDVEMRLEMDPEVARVQRFDWVDGDWRSDHRSGTSSVFVCGLDPHPDGMLFARALPLALRARLAEPGAVIVDRADVDNLGVQVGDRAYINGHAVRVVGISSGLRALGGVNVLASLATARELSGSPPDDHRTTFLLVGLRHPGSAAVVARRLGGATSFGPYQVWTAAQFAQRSQMHWILDTGAGVAVLFLALVVFAVGAVITSQTLVAAVVTSIREYATLNALGVGRRALRRIVMEQAFWVGALGLVGSALLGAVLFAAARERAIPIALDPAVIAACFALNMVLAIVSGLFALRGLRRADPASLLR